MTGPGRIPTPFHEHLLAGQVVVVTGGGTGLGRVMAHHLAAVGATVVVAGRRPDPLSRVWEEITQAGGACDRRVMDIRDAEQVDASIRAVVERHGRLDGLVNNAGGQFVAPAEDLSPNGWRSVVDLNLTGTFLVSQAAFRHWMGANGGSIVNIAAVVRGGMAHMSHSAAARGGVLTLTESLAVEWAGRGVRVNAVAVGIIPSSGFDTYDDGFRAALVDAAAQVPLGRTGTADELAAAVTFLLGPVASYCTGLALAVDGGLHLVKHPVVPLPVERVVPPWPSAPAP